MDEVGDALDIFRISSPAPMNFSRAQSLVLVVALGLAGCRRTISDEERAAREEVRQALHERAFDRAILIARRVLGFAPHDDGAWARLAQAQFGVRDFTGLKKTLKEWQQAVKRPSAKYHEYWGDLAMAENRPAAAVTEWTRALSGKDRKARVYIKLARVEQARGNWQEAVLAWTRAMSPRPTVEALINRAICYRHLHSWEAAGADLQSAAGMVPQDPLVRQETARFDRLGKFLDEVRELDQQLKTQPDDAGLRADRALLFLRAGDAALALDDAEMAARLAPAAVRPKLFGALARRALGQPDQAGLNSSLRLENLAPEFLQTISRLDAQLAAEPKSAELLTNRAWQLNEIGQPELALADAEEAIKSDPKSAGARAEASYALAKLGRGAEAYEQIQRATELDQNFSTAWQYRGELEERQGDCAAAIESLTRALAINRTAAALEKREACYRMLGLLAKAEDDRKALEEISSVR